MAGGLERGSPIRSLNKTQENGFPDLVKPFVKNGITGEALASITEGMSVETGTFFSLFSKPSFLR